MKFLQNNLNGGVISSWLNVRSDLQKFRNSLKVCKNFVCTPYGGLRRRMGTKFVTETRTKSRLIDFQRTSTEGYIIELGDFFVNVYFEGTRVNPEELTSPWSFEEVFDVQYTKLNNVMFLTHRNHPQQELRFNSQTSWSLTPMTFDYPAFQDFEFKGRLRVLSSSSTESVTTVSFNTTQEPEEIISDDLIVNGQWSVNISELLFATATPPDVAPASHFILQRSIDGGVTWVDVQSFNGVGEFSGVLTSSSVRLVALEVEVEATLTAGADVNNLATGDSVTVETTEDFLTAGHVGAEIEVSHSPEITESRRSLTTSGVSPWITVQGGYNLLTSGTWRGTVTIESSMDNGATVDTVISRTGQADRQITFDGEVEDKVIMRIRYARQGNSDNDPFAYLETEGEDIRGRVFITSVTDARNATGTLTAGVLSSDFTNFFRDAAWSNYAGYPAAITWHEGRLWFGGTRLQASTLWASRSDDFFNFEDGTNDDESFSRTMGTTELTDILWLASSSRLNIGTSGEEWVGQSFSDTGIITPSSMVLRRVTNSGSDPVSPVFSGSTLIHTQRQGRSLMQIGFDSSSASAEGLSSTNLNQLAPNITVGKIKTLANQSIRDNIMWATTGKGKLIGLTHDPQQGVSGWHEHETQGEYISVASVYESGNEDSVYVTVRRNGGFFIERFEPDQYDILENQGLSDGTYTDSSVFYDGQARTIFTGLDHLDGQVVQLMTNGEFKGDYNVVNGQIQTDESYTNAIIGLGYSSAFETLPFTFDAQDGSSVARYKRANYVCMRVYRSVTCEVATTIGGAYKWEPMRQEWRTFNDLGLEEEAGELGELEDWKIILSSGYDTDARIACRITEPFPLNVLACSTHFDFSG